MGQQTKRGYKLDQTGDQTQAAINKIINLLPGQLGAIGIYWGTTEYWNGRTGYIPEAGTIIVYTDKSTKEVGGETVAVPGIKIGSGNGYVQDLAFIGDAESEILYAHIADSGIHVNSTEKGFWNRKLNVDDNMEVVEESLVFNRN